MSLPTDKPLLSAEEQTTHIVPVVYCDACFEAGRMQTAKAATFFATMRGGWRALCDEHAPSYRFVVNLRLFWRIPT